MLEGRELVFNSGNGNGWRSKIGRAIDGVKGFSSKPHGALYPDRREKLELHLFWVGKFCSVS
jgi:hypothetical protein